MSQSGSGAPTNANAQAAQELLAGGGKPDSAGAPLVMSASTVATSSISLAKLLRAAAGQVPAVNGASPRSPKPGPRTGGARKAKPAKPAGKARRAATPRGASARVEESSTPSKPSGKKVKKVGTRDLCPPCCAPRNGD